MLETHLRARRDAGHKLLVPYLTAGVTPDWLDYLRAFTDAGADAVEVGLPFSDPTLDGATIQEATARALARGATVRGILDELAGGGLDRDAPLVVSTYYNLVIHDRPERFCAALRVAGIAGLIVPDLPLDEATELTDESAAAEIDLALLASPATPRPRLDEIARRSRGFIYAVSLMGTTGERPRLARSATAIVERIKSATDRPVLVGFGVSTPEHATEAACAADGVIVGAAIMRRVVDGARPSDLSAYLAKLRQAVDEASEDRSTKA